MLYGAIKFSPACPSHLYESTVRPMGLDHLSPPPSHMQTAFEIEGIFNYYLLTLYPAFLPPKGKPKAADIHKNINNPS